MDFDRGFNIGRFFVAWIINDLFCGIGIRIGKEEITQEYDGIDWSYGYVYHLTIQIGYGQLSIGIQGK